VKNFGMATDQNGIVFLHLKEKFLRITAAQIKEGIFVGPQIKETCETLSKAETVSWRTFKPINTNFPRKFKAENYEQLKLLDVYSHGMQNIIKINFLDCSYTRQH
jgi:hypothetical protein